MQQRFKSLSPLKSGIVFTNESESKTLTISIGTPHLRTTWNVNSIIVTYLRILAGFSKFGNGGEPIVSGNITISFDTMIDGFVINKEMVSFAVSRKLKLPGGGEQVGETEQIAAPFVLNSGDITVPPGHQLEIKITLTVTNTSKSNFSNGLLAGLLILPTENLEFSGALPTIIASPSGVIINYELEKIK